MARFGAYRCALAQEAYRDKPLVTRISFGFAAPLAQNDNQQQARAKELLAELGQPLLATTLIAPGETEPMNDPDAIRDRFQKLLAAVVDAGACPMAPTTVIDFSGDEPALVRQGRGDLARLGL